MPRGIRADAIKTERRRRRDDTLDRVNNLKLALPPEFREDKGHAYRWINDDGDRVYSLTKEDDWDICVREAPEGATEDQIRRQVGTKKNGEALYAYLVRKPIDLYEHDKQQNAAANIAREDAMLKRPETDDPKAAGAMYVAAGSSIKRRGAYAP